MARGDEAAGNPDYIGIFSPPAFLICINPKQAVCGVRTCQGICDSVDKYSLRTMPRQAEKI